MKTVQLKFLKKQLSTEQYFTISATINSDKELNKIIDSTEQTVYSRTGRLEYTISLIEIKKYE